MIKGISTDSEIVAKVWKIRRFKKKTVDLLDSDSANDHVPKGLKFYWPVVTKGRYVIAFDAVVEHSADEFCNDSKWMQKR